ncbi:MAG: ATP synthase subunit I [Eubacteriales bacterium]|nr:ATP synthase subunit I [Bacillota bacterium]
MQDWDFGGQLSRTLKLSAGILVFFCLMLLLKPADPVVLGLFIGAAAGMWNAYFLGRRIRAIENIAIPSAKAKMQAGFPMRLSVVIAVLFFVSRVQIVNINIFATAAGMFIAPCLFTFITVGGLIREARESAAFRYNKNLNQKGVR